jgi:riboflavin kinase / FMN adenylyltransferase
MIKGMLSIGTRPTFDDSAERVEINLFDFNEDIYGEEIVVHIHKYLRPQVKYSNACDLQLQMSKDKDDSLAALLNRAAS